MSKLLAKIGRSIQQRRLINRNFTLFSNDCWGAEVYKYFNLPYNTPFVGLMVMAPCYVQFLQTLSTIWTSHWQPLWQEYVPG
ncbi:DUF1919 domain-containing protein [Hymenobacter terrestris]|uniref:DUF1919 domain-containing protein n=1 Tax=Hymenobacter terrestris TaxID=2748310 RepID=A0ABX2Q4N4_9BACT|nr:DUF1919 domain-containing protein [Hymenobacter terrestris]